jgi:MmyB-like transcription regulator ligand binding domain
LPRRLAPRIANLAEWSEQLLLRLRHRIARQGDDDLAKLHDELASYPGVRAARGSPAEPGQRVVLPLEYRTDQGVLRFLNTTTCETPHPPSPFSPRDGSPSNNVEMASDRVGCET